MRVLHVATYQTGGAAIAMQRIHKALDSKTKSNTTYFCNLSNNKNINNSEIQIFNKVKRFFKKPEHSNYQDWEIEVFLNQIRSSRSNTLEYLSLPVSNIDLTKTEIYWQADLINLHWVANGLDWPTFFKKNKKPVVWTLHDMNPFSGIEHYKEPYLGMDESGSPLPRTKSESEISYGEKWLALKKMALNGVNDIHIVSPSQWLLELSQKSELFNRFPHYYIPYSVPEKTFKFKDKGLARAELGLPGIEKKIFLFVADSIENERKGYAYLIKAINQLNPDSDICLLAVGHNDTNNVDSNILHLGKISDERTMATVYTSADAFIIPSLEDNLPNTMLESLMCGTPVIGFPVGGIQETILDGFNGYLCESIGVQPLAACINKFLDNADSFSREAIAADAFKKFATGIQAKAYIKLYEEILTAKK